MSSKQEFVEQVTVVAEELQSADPADKTKRFTARLSQANTLNRNNRVYPRNVLEPAVERAKTGTRRNPGKLEHPSPYEGGRLNTNAILWENFWFEGNDELFGQGRIIETQAGLDLWANIKAGVEVGFSKRGTGRTEEQLWGGQIANVLVEYDLITVDSVDDPSHENARVRDFVGESNLEQLTQLVENLTNTKATLLVAEGKLVDATAAVAVASAARIAAEASLVEANQKIAELTAELGTKTTELVTSEAALAEVRKTVSESIEDQAVTLVANLIEAKVAGHRFAAAIKEQLASLSDSGIAITVENAEGLIASITPLVEKAAEAAGGFVSGRGIQEKNEDQIPAKGTFSIDNLTEGQIAELKASGLLG